MKKLVAVGLILLSIRTYAQQNLVPNGSFEEITQCPTGSNQINRASPWTNTVAGSPDLFNECGPSSLAVPTNGGGFQEARSGSGYAGFHAFNLNNGREFLQIKLSESMTSGTSYLVKFYVSLMDNCKYSIRTLGAFLSDTMVIREQYSIENFQVQPQILNSSITPLSDKENWVLICDTFNCRFGGEEYLIIGNFHLDDESDTTLLETGIWYHSYYYIDDVSVVALDSVPSSVEDIAMEQNNFSVYPNPANQYATVAFDVPTAEGPLSVLVVDVQGRIVKTIPLSGQTDQTVIDTDGLGSGTYHFLLVDGNNSLASFEVSIVR